MSATIGILGASGFVGSALCERLYFQGRRDFIPFIRSSGNAWRLSRLGGLRLRSLDITDRAQVFEAVGACDVVVNCALGNDAAMFQGLQNVLDAARNVGLRRFVHLSSIAIYGQDPPPESTTEAAKPDPSENAYGIAKLRQDEMVMKLHRAGVPCYILCPGNITGPYSFFARGMVEWLAAGPVPLVDQGRYPSNLVHVDNLVEAVLRAVDADGGAGVRYFVNEVRPVSWRQLFQDLSRLLGAQYAFTDVSRDEVLPHVRRVDRRPTLASKLRLALAEQSREALSALPIFGWLNASAAAGFRKLPARAQMRIKERLQWPVRIPKVADSGPRLDDRYVTVQTRRVYHSPERLQTTLGWEPPLSYETGLDTLAAWLRFAGIVPPSSADITVA